MSISLEGITKVYGTQKALDSVNFTASKGEIIGLLGPNGAGKTTIMKILTCFIPPTEGTAKVCELDVSTDSLEVRKKIGYLPEHNPLYQEMYVREYLLLIAKIFDLKDAKAKVEELIQKTGLTPEANKKIEFLSKGYRQRVGIAQALMNDPEVLILDEPTSGLDPNQLVEIRALIRDIGKEKLVIFSSHIMDQVQALCTRLIIIDKGKIVANDAIDTIAAGLKGEKKLIVNFKTNMAKESLLAIKGVSDVHVDGNNFTILSSKDQDIREAVFDLAVASNNKILSMTEDNASVETIFQTITSNS